MLLATTILCLGLTTDAPAADLNALVRLIAGSSDSAIQADLLRGTLEAVDGRRRVAMPSAWTEAYPALARSTNPGVRDAATRLALIFGDPKAITSLRALAANRSAETAPRVEAIEALSRVRDQGVVPVLQGLLTDPAVRAAALRGLASTEHPETPALILKTYPTLTLNEKADALGTLAARPGSALALLTAVEREAVPKAEVPASALQALASHADPRVKAALGKIWGEVRPSSAEKKGMIERLKGELTTAALARADRSHGRLLFAKTCASCHTLFDAGGKVGPELTGSQRTNLDYVLSNVVDPGAVVARDYQVAVFQTTDGRVVAGIIKREDDRSVAVQTANELVVIPKPEIEARRATTDSMMPEGLLKGLEKNDIRDLVGYLAGATQVPLATPSPNDKGGR
jgi:putative heme-binding domain-containing protein